MKVVTSQEMRCIDKITIEKYGILGIVLMENAGRYIADVCENYIVKNNAKNILIVVGKGNNGGDGVVVGRLLKNRGYNVSIVIIPKREEFKGDAKINVYIAYNIGLNIKNYDDKILNEEIEKCDFILDAIFGTGIKGEVKEPYKSIIDTINESGKYIISVDIPSGLDGDTGKVCGSAIIANETATINLYKRGLLLDKSYIYTGKISVGDISIPDIIYKNDIEIKCNMLTEKEAKELMPKRIKRSNKGTYGKLFVLAGSRGMTGAAYLCSKSAYRTGCGLVYSCIVKSAVNVIQNILPEAVCIPLEEKDGFVCNESIKNLLSQIKNGSALIVGPGLGNNEEVYDVVKNVIVNSEMPMVIDADGLNVLSRNVDILNNIKSIPVITPHPKEMERLIGIPVNEILENTVDVALDFAKKYNCVVLLKDSRTIIANPNGEFYINTRGNSSLAKGGSGDVLTGIIGSLLVQGLKPFESAVLGAYIHGVTGEKAKQIFTPYGALAGDFCDIIPKALQSILE